ncbi:MAG: rRNA (guanine1207-N2)-methyltransferase [Actinomycetota bacterium]|nr:rRNA (guanine1207-N2)-methyltransferase [Actinomycetota bacterium]
MSGERLSLMSDAFSFQLLARYPDLEADNLVAVDATDRLVLDEAAAAIEAAGTERVVVIGDHYGALTLGAIALHGARNVRVHQDLVSGEQALANNAVRTGLDTTGDLDATRLDPGATRSDPSATRSDHGATPMGPGAGFRQLPLTKELFLGATVVIGQLPKSLDALREIAQLAAAHADPDVAVFLGGRVKHMTRTMNDVLHDSFADVRASLARQKSRVLVAGGPRPAGEAGATAYPVRHHHLDLDLWVCAHGAAFGGTKLDLGTRFLLEFLDQMHPAAETAVDLGCGTGIIATTLARTRPQLRVLATDESAGAVSSALATVAANGQSQRVTVQRDNAMSTVADASVDLIACNPPFHLGTSVHSEASVKLFQAAGRVLRPGGQLWTVFNSHLPYRSQLTDAVGPTRVIGRNAKFTVTESNR